jgi:hypothetical protein
MQSPSLVKLMWIAAVVFFCMLIPSLRAQTSDAQAIESKSWTTITESHPANTNPTRTTESHRQSGKGIVDSQSVERLGADGHYEPYFDIEKESVQVNDTTIRTVERTFGRDGGGHRLLTQVTEEEKQSLPAGDEKVVRTTSDADLGGHLQVVRRELTDTRNAGPDAQEKKTTVFLSDGRGGMAAGMQIQQREKRSGDHTVEVQKSTLLLDGAGNWQVGEMRQATISEDGKSRSTEERISRPDSEGKLGEVSRTVSKESESASGERGNTVETYSVDVPGSAQDGSLHLVERATTAQHTSSTGQQTTEQQVEQLNPGDPGSGLRVTILTTHTVRLGPSGAQATRTIQVRDANGSYGSFGVVSVDTTKSDNIHAIQVQIAPSEKPKQADAAQKNP